MPTFTIRLAVVFAFLVLPGSGLVAAGSPELLSAIRNGDHARAQKLLAAGADVNTADADGTTALMHAVIESDVKMMKLLMERGANVNAKNSSDSTALMYAVTDLAKTRLLLDAKAAVKVKNKRGATPMSVAAMPAGSTPRFETPRKQRRRSGRPVDAACGSEGRPRCHSISTQHRHFPR
jgi:hypothetical protein